MNKKQWFSRALACNALCLWTAPLWAQDAGIVSLKQAVNRALQTSREVVLAQARYTVALNATGVSGAVFRPNLYAGSGAGFTYGIPQTVSGAAPSIANVTYIQTIFNPVLRGQALEARERAEVQRIEVERTRNAVVLQTVSTYLDLAKVRHSLDRVREQRQSRARILDFTRQRIKEGLELPIAETRETLEIAKIEQRIVGLEGQQRLLEDQLAFLIGAPRDRAIQLDSETLNLIGSLSEEDLIRRAMETNQELVQLEHERRARERRLAGEKGAKWPTLDLGAEYALLSKTNNFEDFFRKFQRNNVNVGIQVRLPIFSSDRSAKVALAASELNVAEIQLRNRRQSLELEIKRQYQRVRELEASREVARLEQQLARESLQVVQAGFEEGRVNLRDVDRARLEENEKWIAFLDTDYERQKAQVELLNLTGELSSLFEQKP